MEKSHYRNINKNNNSNDNSNLTLRNMMNCKILFFKYYKVQLEIEKLNNCIEKNLYNLVNNLKMNSSDVTIPQNILSMENFFNSQYGFNQKNINENKFEFMKDFQKLFPSYDNKNENIDHLKNENINHLKNENNHIKTDNLSKINNFIVNNNRISNKNKMVLIVRF